MKLADAKRDALEDGEDWRSLPLVEKLQRIDTYEGHSLYEHYGRLWTATVSRSWLSWGLGFVVTREVWNPERLHASIEAGPFCLMLTREWSRGN